MSSWAPPWPWICKSWELMGHGCHPLPECNNSSWGGLTCMRNHFCIQWASHVTPGKALSTRRLGLIIWKLGTKIPTLVSPSGLKEVCVNVPCKLYKALCNTRWSFCYYWNILKLAAQRLFVICLMKTLKTLHWITSSIQTTCNIPRTYWQFLVPVWCFTKAADITE